MENKEGSPNNGNSAYRKNVLTFVLVHLVLITLAIVTWAYLMYPDEEGAVWWRQRNLKVLYEALQEYKTEHGSYPENLAMLRVDKEGYFFFDNKKLERFSIVDPNRLSYRIVEGGVVLTDLGCDNKPGGMGSALDVSYPTKYQKDVSFFAFLMTGAFVRSLFFGLILASAMSACLYGIWNKRFSRSAFSLGMVVFVSLVFLAFESFLAFMIMMAHIYPHH
jgi:hypothetical protein